ncbi:hypothetical protein V5E97_22470 [Singulisphaera sp. Ch08]|uniref:Uncharacterized protein n=1 Tax=Singulisphaera sp. Ch08 TaxID=3120278 RepID=A0AAU7C7K7_9BACT
MNKGNEVVATTVTATAKEKWDDAGWTTKLQEAVQEAGGNFVGPLATPYEPWHYIYKPATAQPKAGNTYSSDMCGTSFRRH